MWKSLFVTRGDLIVFMDADLVDWDTHFVPACSARCSRRRCRLVKGFYERTAAARTPAAARRSRAAG